MTDSAVQLQHVSKSYRRGREIVPVLAGITFDIARGEFVALMGPSGSGKSTLLNLIAGIDRPDDGVLRVGGLDITALRERVAGIEARLAESVSTLLESQGVRMIRGTGRLVGPVAFPKQTGAATVYWTGENSGSDVTGSNVTFGTVNISPKTCMATGALSRQLIIQSTPDVGTTVILRFPLKHRRVRTLEAPKS